MGRTVSATLAEILSGPRMLDYAIDLKFPDGTFLHFATSPLTIDSTNYQNRIVDVRELRQTIELVPDRVRIILDNNDRQLSGDIAANTEKWRRATATVYRIYRGGGNFSLRETVIVFSGGVQQPEADDRTVQFDLLHDTLVPGKLIASANLSPLCQNVFRDSKTCGYTGSASECNHRLKSEGGCDGRNNSHRFRGMEHRHNPDLSVPGSGGNNELPGPGTGGGTWCPRIDQLVLARQSDAKGFAIATRAGDLKAGDFLWNPITSQFVQIKEFSIRQSEEIFRIRTSSGEIGIASGSHRVICDQDDFTGKRLDSFRVGEQLLTYSDNKLHYTTVAEISTVGSGRVAAIELNGTNRDKIYCWGQNRFLVCHNSKPIDQI